MFLIRMGRVSGRFLPWLLLVAACTSALAAEPRSRWFLGGSLAYRATTDEIRSNAAISLGPLGADGIPYTFDTGEVAGCIDPGTFCDPRPDDLLNSPAVIQDGYQYSVHAGFLPMSWLSVQLDASYFKADVGPIDAYLADHYPYPANPNDPSSLLGFKDRGVRLPLEAGSITEVPVSLTVAVHFKTLRPLKPYLGVGVGRIYTDFEEGSDIPAFNERVSHMRIRVIADGFGRNVTPKSYFDIFQDDRFPLPEAITIEHTDSSEWHLNAGAELMLSSRVGLVFDARYSFAPGAIRFDVAGHDQVDLLIWSEKLFRPDGSLFIFGPGYDPLDPLAPFGAPAPNTLCFYSNFIGIGCDVLHMAPGLARVNPNGIDPVSGGKRFTCPARGDFDRDGVRDVCYGFNVVPSEQGYAIPRGDLVIQGGEINLSAFVVSVGLRFHF